MAMDTFAARLHPGDDLMLALDRLAQTNDFEAACVLACVGSLIQATLRFANQDRPVVLRGHFEIVSLTGTLSKHGSHYHIAIANEEGRTYGAHLMEGCLIYTTAEIVIGALPNLRFLRTHDLQTGYPELDIQPNTKNK